MSTSRVIVACCQLRPVLGDNAANLAMTTAAIREAAATGAQVVVLPELVSSGYAFTSPQEAAMHAEPADGPTVTAWAALARELGIVIVGGFCERDSDGEPRNSAVLIDASGVRAVYRKVHLWDRERLLFKPGEAPPPVVQTPFGRIAVVICYDMEFPEWVRVAALAGAQLLCAPVNWPLYPRPEGERPGEVVRLQADAAMNRMFIAACDRVGEERGVDWLGGSTIVDADGWPLAGATSSSAQGIITATCDLAAADDKHIGGLSDAFGDRRPDLYRVHLH